MGNDMERKKMKKKTKQKLNSISTELLESGNFSVMFSFSFFFFFFSNFPIFWVLLLKKLNSILSFMVFFFPDFS